MPFLPLFPEPVHRPIVIAGPCSAETEEQVLETAHQLVETNKRLKAQILQNSNGHGLSQPMQVALFRAGIWKPRTRPDSFEGVGAPGLRWLKRVKEETGLPVTTEVANARHASEALKYGIDVLWIGARTTVNPFSVQEIAEAIEGLDIPILVKNPINADLELWMGAIERFAKVGIKRLAVIHRGFANHSQATYRNDPMWQIPLELMRRFPGLQIICDPSHICGNRHRLLSIAQKAMDLNYTGVMIETHPTPDAAWSDASQQITPYALYELLNQLVVREFKPQDEVVAHSLEDLRSLIDEVDDQLMDLLSKRMAIVDEIGKVKQKNNVSIFQPERWSTILDRCAGRGKEKGLSEEFVTKYLEAIHDESIQHQEQVMNAGLKVES